jgi:signal transduction histidine kinase
MKPVIPLLMTLRMLVSRLPAPDTELAHRVYCEQQALLMRQCLNMGLVNIIIGALVCAMFAPSAALWQIGIWYVPIFLYGLGQIALWARFRRSRTPKRSSGRFLRSAEGTGLIMGCVWGLSIFLLPGDAGSGFSIVFLMLVQCGMSAGLASLLTTLPRLVFRFTAGSVGITLAGLVAASPDNVLLLLALSSVYASAIVAGNLVSFRQLVSSVQANLAVEQARANLSDAINSARDAFAILGPKGEVVMANASHKQWFGDGPVATPMASGEPQPIGEGRWVIASARPMGSGGQVVIHSDVTALKARERELIEARREAEQADEAKTRFLNTMSHELRTPLNVILGFARLMSPQSKLELSETEVAEYAAQIHTSADHLLALINDIIDYSQIGMDTRVVEFAEVRMDELLERIVEGIRQINPVAEGVAFTIDLPPALRRLRLHERSTRRILLNLLSNAVKFRGSEARVLIRAAVTAEGQPFITVRDFGIGMNEAQLQRAFEAFYQASSSLSRNYDGTGLGLTIARHLARQMGGDVVLKSRPGAGTAATLLLPAVALIDTPAAGDALDVVLQPLPDPASAVQRRRAASR